MGGLLSKVGSGIRAAPHRSIEALRYLIWYIKLTAPYKMSTWGLYLALRLLYVVLRSFWWLLRGVTYRRWRNKKLQNFKTSAHVQNIIGRYKMDPVLEFSAEYNFVTYHHSFQHPEYVLRDSVTLYQITESSAIFVETPPDLDVTLSDVASFMRVAQFQHAKKLIYMPIESFHRIAKQLGRPKANITFVNNTTRCGSTVLLQMFEKTGHCRSMSEPDALNCIAYLARRESKLQIRRLLESVVRVLCKPYKGKHYDSYVLKTTAPGIYFTDLMNEVFPDSRVLFMYRNGVQVADSLSKASVQMPILRMGYIIFSSLSILYTQQKQFAEYFCNFPDLPCRKLPSVYACCVFTWGMILYRYLELVQKGADIVGVKYEHLIANPKENMRIILEHCGLPTEWAESSLKALESDSQRNSPLSMKHLKALEGSVETFDMEKNKVIVDVISAWCGLDYDAPKDFVAAGTITVPVKQRPTERIMEETPKKDEMDSIVVDSGKFNVKPNCREL
ncbi:hypothetical protein CAPTEDRAFT_193976 [Capitella teleta]|uniref:Sulfotransferase domain-containing protein n=1 Tax=Capitella teleta TaxID=283909 RepID=R7UKY4_CAPTE|nr:hypothetical protein CAPTEDRAFT_193976 [Capitella teleta]|eukprot:ELU06768.1 hypothetical protein CAPTEDRAFT_193976 [Capitella teleta]